MQRSTVDFAFSKSPSRRSGWGWSIVWTSRLTPSLSHVWSWGACGSTLQDMMLSGARPSIFFRRSRMGRRKASYFAGSDMSSIERIATASTPSSPIHWGVVSFGNEPET